MVIAWLFAAGMTTHVLPLAGLENPTVRRRYVEVRNLLARYGCGDFYPGLDAATVARHLDALEPAFAAAGAVVALPFPFAADLGAQARPVAIDGSRALIARGDHREAVFWIVATATRCQQVLTRDAPPALRDRFASDYARPLADLGIATPADLPRRGDETEDFPPGSALSRRGSSRRTRRSRIDLARCGGDLPVAPTCRR